MNKGSPLICKPLEIRREEITPEMMASVTRQSSHCLLYTRSDVDKKPIIMMQVRGDGYLGFPGGFLEPGETPEHAVNRELQEEMVVDEEIHYIHSSHYMISHYFETTGLLSHFFAVEFSSQDFCKIEQKTLSSPEYGHKEVSGILRVPMYAIENGESSFSVFIKHQFIGAAKLQLLYSVEKLGFLTREEIQRALKVEDKNRYDE